MTLKQYRLDFSRFEFISKEWLERCERAFYFTIALTKIAERLGRDSRRDHDETVTDDDHDHFAKKGAIPFTFGCPMTKNGVWGSSIRSMGLDRNTISIRILDTFGDLRAAY